MIDELPAHLHEQVVALWHATGLTRPWNDPHDDLRRALSSPSGTVLVAVAEDWLAGRAPKVQLMIRREDAATMRFYEHLGYEPSEVVVLGRWTRWSRFLPLWP